MASRITRLASTAPWSLPLLLFLVALLPRLVALDRYITPDELLWVFRSIQFREAVLTSDWAATLVAGHPGVTTTWLGALGMTLQLWISPSSMEAYSWLLRLPYLLPDNVEAFNRLADLLSSARLMVIIVNSGGIVAIFYLVRRLWGWPAAAISGLFLALDPFLVGLSGLLHVDGLSATFATVALMGLATAHQPASRSQRRFLPLVGVAAGLAILTKTPTLLLLPVIALFVTVGWWRKSEIAIGSRLRGIVMDGLIIAAAVVFTIILLYPALWVAPAEVWAVVSGSANRHLDEALRETFFMGQVAYDHGPLFYPVVLLWRLSPVVWLTLVPLVWWLWQLRQKNKAINWPRLAGPSLLLLLVWALIFIVAITPAAKKFDRYLLPVVPSLLLLAGYVWVSWSQRFRSLGITRWILLLVVGIQALYLVSHFGFPLSAYNPLVGGGRTAVQVMPVGWGEGISTAGRTLSSTEPDAAEQVAMAGIASSLSPFFVGQTLVDGVDDPREVDYRIISLTEYQLDPAVVDRHTSGFKLLETLRYGGLDQVWIYQQDEPVRSAQPQPLAEPVVFGGRMSLTAMEQVVADDTLRLTLWWQRNSPLAVDERYIVRLTVVDDSGNIWASSESELLNDVYFYPPDWDEDASGPVRYGLELPPAIPPGNYWSRLSLIDTRTMGLLPLQIGPGDFQGVTYTMGMVEVPLPETIVSASRLQIPKDNGTRWLNGDLWLLGQSALPAEVLAGSEIPVELFWHAPNGQLPPGLQLAWRLTGDGLPDEPPIAEIPLSRFDTGQWRVGETIHERYMLPVSPKLAPGKYQLEVQPLLLDGTPVLPPSSLGEMRLNNIDRLYELPDDIGLPLDTCFGQLLCLRGAEMVNDIIAPGETTDLTLYWLTSAEPDQVYTVFLHLLDSAGEIVLSADHWPGGLPTDILDIGQIIIDRVALAIPGDLPPGDYSFRVGIYSPGDGIRLPVTSGAGAGDHLILPVTLEIKTP